MRIPSSQKLAPHAGRPLGELGLAAAVAHEVRRLLTPAKAYAELALAGPSLSSEASQAVLAILRAATECDAVLEALVASGGNSEHSCSDVHEVARQINCENLHVHIAPALFVSMSRPRLLIVLSNLVSNGLRASGSAVQVEITAEPCSTRNTVQVRVIDRGSGMTAGQVKQATQPFVSFSSGTGMGLAICQHLVEEAGGTLWIASVEGRGTCVTLELPRAEAAELKKSA